MKNFINLAGVGTCLVSALMFNMVPSSRASINMLVDPSFESQTPPGSGGWNLFNGAAFNNTQAHSGTWSMLDAAANNVPGSFEEFTASAGMKFQLTGYGMTTTTLLGSPAFGLIQISYFDSSHNNLGTVETSPGNAKTSGQINSSTTPGVWTLLDTGVATAPANTAFIQAFTIYVGNAANSQGVYFDDLALVPIPEPSSLGLLGVGVGFLIWRRRRK